MRACLAKTILRAVQNNGRVMRMYKRKERKPTGLFSGLYLPSNTHIDNQEDRVKSSSSSSCTTTTTVLLLLLPLAKAAQCSLLFLIVYLAAAAAVVVAAAVSTA